MDARRKRITHITAAAVLGAALLVPAAAAQPTYPRLEEDEEPARRRNSHIGVGLGFTTSTSVVEEVFGDGTDASIYVHQRVWKILGVRASFGALYLGSPNLEAEWETYVNGIDFFGASFNNFSMSYTYITIGPSLQFHFMDNHSFLASAAYGLYDVKLDLASLEAHRLSVQNDRHGLHATLQYSYWIGDSWGLNARLDVHRIYTTEAEDDLYYHFVRGDSDPRFHSFLVGVHVGYR